MVGRCERGPWAGHRMHTVLRYVVSLDGPTSLTPLTSSGTNSLKKGISQLD